MMKGHSSPTEETLPVVAVPERMKADEEKRSSPATDAGALGAEGAVVIPDGGLRAWTSVFGAFMISICCFGVVTTFGVFQAYYESIGLQEVSAISWIGALQPCLLLLVGCFSGPLFDAGHLKKLQLGAGGLYIFSLMMTSISSKYYQVLLSQGLGVGLAMGLIFSPTLSTISHHLTTKASFGFGIFAGGASVGGATLPIMMEQLLPRIGFGWSIRVLAFIALFCLVCGIATTSTRLPPRKGAKVLDFTVFKDLPYTLVVAGSTIIALGVYLPISYGVTFATSRGIDRRLAFYSLAVLNATSLPGRVLPGLVARRYGAINILLLTSLVSAVMIYVWTLVRSTAAHFVFMAIYGFWSGAYVAVLPASISSVTRNPNEMGLRLGMCFFWAAFGWLGGPPVQGALIRSKGYLAATIYSGSIVVVGVALLLVGRHKVVKIKGKPWV